MKIITHCPKCIGNVLLSVTDGTEALSERHHVAAESDRQSSKLEFLVEEGNVYDLMCPNGHKFYMVYQADKFELLFYSGVYAVLDGYLREAVSNFATSLERFYEFAIRAMCHFHNIAADEFTNSWKKVSNQSERQFGAFVYLYLITTKKTPSVLSHSQVEFRNAIVHKGQFPKMEKTKIFGKDVLNVINENLIELNKHIPKSIIAAYREEMDRLTEEYGKKNETVMVMGGMSIVMMVTENYPLTYERSESDCRFQKQA